LTATVLGEWAGQDVRLDDVEHELSLLRATTTGRSSAPV